MKIKFFSYLLTILIIVSCGKDDDTTVSYIGTWVATNIDITNCDDSTNDDFRSVQCTDNSCYRIIFSDDGTYSFQTGLAAENGTWSVSGVTITFCIDEDGEQICKTGIGTITSSLRLSFTSDADQCVTAYIMDKVEETTGGGA